ncbi:MAG: DUF1311 domain-containing protein [Sulfuricella sp.]|nr:DUF1311 domain-containing protein [Sulfuricella sp.]
MRLILAFVIYVLFPAQPHAASFDCDKAKSRIEKLICADNDVSILDTDLTSYFRQALATVKDAEAAKLKIEQRRWLRGVRDKCATPACLKEAYEKRVETLGKLAGIKDDADDNDAEAECRKLGYPSGGSQCMALIRGNDVTFTEGKLTRTYQSLLKLLTDKPDLGSFFPDKDEIINLQASWEKYRDRYCSLYGSLLAGPSSASSAHESECISDLSDRQNAFLEKLLKCVQNNSDCSFEY